MFRIYFILFTLLNITAYSQQWIPKQTPTSLWLYTCSFPDTLHGWAAGENGVIIKTSDGGETWQSQASPIDYFIYKIHFADSLNGWAVANDNFGSGTTVLHTINGGATWNSSRFADSLQYFQAVQFLNSSTGFTGGFGGAIYKTTNTGMNWTRSERDSTPNSALTVYNVEMYSQHYGFATGGGYDIAGVIWKTTDKGLSWISIAPSSEPLFDLHYFDSLNVIAAGGDFEFGAMTARTTDAGVTWTYNTTGIFGIARAVSFRTPQDGWMALSFAQSFARSTDGGETWFTIPIDNLIYDLTFLSPQQGWAVGKNGVVLKYNPQHTGIESGTEILPDAAKLYQNYPNPFNPVTEISYELKSKGDVSLDVYDITGKLITTLYKGVQQAGNYTVNFDGSNYSSGLYIYVLQSSNMLISKKMMLLK